MRSENSLSNQRKTPSQGRSKATCDAIISAAAHIVEQQGEAGLTTNRVAERAGVSIGSVYQYYGNKQEILVALAERAESGMPSSGQALKTLSSDHQESQLRMGVRAYITMLPDNPKARKSALSAVLESRGSIGVARETDKRFEAVGAYDGLSKVDRFVVSRAITGVVQSAVQEEWVDIKSREFEDALVRVARCFLADPS